jgi:hypothetical protein
MPFALAHGLTHDRAAVVVDGRDLDLLGSLGVSRVERMRPMPEPLGTEVPDVARAYGLADDWVNLGPESLRDQGNCWEPREAEHDDHIVTVGDGRSDAVTRC